ncbi:MAG: phosphotransferase [Proteobacteria bacterium]|nr:phosphotransferase [Pseudomonadota bacterium]
MNDNEAISWASDTLAKLGINLLEAPKLIRAMPWSKVTCFSTSKGNIYLKQMSAQFAVEPLVLNLLKEMSVPATKVIAHNEKELLFLMLDAGSCLREKLKTNYDTALVCQLLKSYAKIQLESIAKVENFLALDVKDWRLSQLPSLYNTLLSEENLLLNDGLSITELNQLKEHHNTFVEDCARLAAFGIPETIEHGDFHDNNILISVNNQFTFNDWGDANITHPFFSLGSWLDSASRHHNLQKQDPRYLMLSKAYLEAWGSYAPLESLFEAFEVSERLRPILFSINFCRVVSCEGMEKLGQFKGYISDALKEYIVSSINV